jgi:drug/metabolite transporter (DMT)-like permease
VLEETEPKTDLIKGAALLVAAFAVIPLMDGAAKQLARDGYDPVFIAWGRFVLSTIMISPMLLRRGAWSRMVGPGFGLQVVRALMLTIATVLFFSAIKTMPLADALAVYFVYPFLITLMAPWFLGEQVGIRRYAAVLVGFAGSLLVIRPGFEDVPVGVYYILGASICFAVFNLLTRKLSGKGGPWSTVLLQSIVGTVALSPFAPMTWQTPDAPALGLMALMIAAAVLGHWLLIKAYEQAPASHLAPFGYFEIVAAVAVGFFWFGDFPDAFTWLGIAVIVATGTYISVRERKRRGVA